MAEASSSPEAQILCKIKQEHLTCQICHSGYTFPKALPCVHTFCACCLQDYIFSRRYDETGFFPCPMCRVRVEIPKEGVDGFPDNHMVVTLMDTVQRDEDLASPAIYPDLTDMMTDLKTPNSTHLPPSHSRSTGQLMEVNASGHRIPRSSQSTGQLLNTNHGQAPPKPRRLLQNNKINSKQAPPRPGQPPQKKGGDTPPSHAPLQRRLILPVDSYQVPVAFNYQGAELIFGQFGEGLTDFHFPVGMDVSPEGNIIIGDQKENRVFVFERSGKLKTIFTCQGKIQDLAVNSRGLMYIANTQAKRSLVTCYNSRGHTVASLGSFFTFEKPHGVTVMEDNHIAVTSIDTHQVYMLNEYGKLTHKFTGKGKDGKRLNYPYHLSVSKKNRVIVSDYGNDCVKVFDNTGKCKIQIGKYGSKPGQFNGPRGLCVDRNDNIVVADSRNHRVQVFNSKGTFLGVTAECTQDTGVGGCPMNVAVTNDSKLVVLLSGGSFAQVRVYPYKF